MVRVDAELERAVARARVAVGAPDDVPARATHVERLDRPTGYVLVDLGAPGSPGWVAAVDPVHDDVLAWAVNASGDPTIPVNPPGPASRGEAADHVWWAGGPSRSPLYPLLRVTTPDGVRFRDVTGRWHSAGPTGTRG